MNSLSREAPKRNSPRAQKSPKPQKLRNLQRTKSSEVPKIPSLSPEKSFITEILGSKLWNNYKTQINP